MKHYQQEEKYSCGAACYKIVFEEIYQYISEEQAIKECQTTSKGTYSFAVLDALKKRNIAASLIPFNQNFDECKDVLSNISRHYPFIASGTFRSRKHNKGRDNKRQHAVLFADGFAYDPAEKQEIDIECYEITFNKSLLIRDILIVEVERPNYGKNKI